MNMRIEVTFLIMQYEQYEWTIFITVGFYVISARLEYWRQTIRVNQITLKKQTLLWKESWNEIVCM